MFRWFNELYAFIELSWVLFLLPAIVIFFLRKDYLALRFVCITSAFFLFGAFIYEPLKTFDKDINIYRYVIWAFNDIAWMALIAYLGLKDKVYLWQCVLGQLVVVMAPTLQLFRVVDRHLWDLSYSTLMYKTLLPLINISTVVVCYLPLIYILVKNKEDQISSKYKTPSP
ncbi:hypothetical protein OIZ54_18295 [Pseudoalteromonas sp. A3]|uniref:Uncharacterized protein n=1 Tax=Pseudoalteromonas agarivorans DSM 14585 TaxID=1312369 RepID=A0ACA8DY96_9GAMM|nr:MULTISPECIES: hypothetical protein [Pseudoalteromonas]ATC83192.1 hypothetical protein PAGA_a2986 [Pseudoalteromonas agarivorans DSM 14585]MCK8097533.1 hypothetical protein [Pseudoalteromonas sp. 1CM17D]MCK8135940.1 hypothetical protein [Pseudoalteromonas sp. 2CM28B]MCW1720689.1 hypothetical protein [Pseudoalteromonas sp. A3]MDC9515348.1 hypothetical protein [Pseudoalteromonas sp. CST1]|tara:strand:- start:84 stop:593 length:510 start_codon:yes stop_codon:yes gene_type:complete